MSLNPLGSFVEQCQLLLLLFLLLAHDRLQGFPLLVLLQSLLPLFLEVGKGLLLLLQDVKLLNAVGVVLFHFQIVSFKGRLVLGVGRIKLTVHVLFLCFVVILCGLQL
jgi:hypothetical protein